MNIFKHEGDAIDYTPDDDTIAGQIVVLGGLIGVTKLPILAGQLGALALKGVFLGDKAAEAFALGAAVYYDTADDELNSSSGGNTLAGYVVKAAESGDTAVWFRLAN